MLVGAPLFDAGEQDEGVVFVFRGSQNGIVPGPAWTLEVDQAGAAFGSSVASAGDVNGDGYDDVIVGAPKWADGELNEGAAFLYLGSAASLTTTPAWSAEGDQIAASFGTSVSTAGDVNGDGYDDVVVGARGLDGIQPKVGAALVYLGSASGTSSSPGWIVTSDQTGSAFGYSVATAGDVNGDGYDEVLVGAYKYALSGPARVPPSCTRAPPPDRPRSSRGPRRTASRVGTGSPWPAWATWTSTATTTS